MPDWVFTSIGWALAAIAALLLLYALVGDRSWGRARCPRCWYDLRGQLASQSAPPWTCPECGREVASRRQLNRTHRRWWLVALAMALVLGAWLTACAPGIYQRGLWAAMPRPLLLAMVLADPPAFDGIPMTKTQTGWYRELLWRYRRPIGWCPGESWLAERVMDHVMSTRYEPIVGIRAHIAEVLVQTGANRSQPAASDEAGRKLWEQIERTYAEAKTYRDVGVRIERGGRDDMIVWQESAFSTAARRDPQALLLDMRTEFDSGNKPRTRFVTWGCSRTYSQRLGVRFARDYGDAHSAMMMTGLAFGPAGLFFGGIGGVAPEPALLGEETFDGRRCFRLQTTAAKGGYMLIDAESYVIRKHSDWHQVIVFRPELDVDLPDDALTYNPDTDQPQVIGDGEGLADKLRRLIGPPPPP